MTELDNFVNPYDNVPETKSEEFIISSDYYEEEKLSEAEQIRNNYEDALPEDYEEATIMCNACSVFVSTKEKISRNGKPYTSNLCITRLYIDEDETKVAFFDEMFDKYDEKKNRITVTGNHPLAEIVRGLTGNTQHNRFILDLDKFQEKLNKLDQLRVRIYSYDDNGYERYSFKLLAVSEK